MKNSNVYMWAVIFLAGIALLVYGSISRPEILRMPTYSPKATSTSEFSPIVNGTPPAKVSPSPEKFESFAGLKAPASCLVAGEVTYLDKKIYSSTDNARISWKNVDSTGRLIKWRSEPADNLAIGPNIFANLDIPDGDYGISIGLPEKPVAKEYILFASVTYGQLINGNVEVKETACSGFTKVKLNF